MRFERVYVEITNACGLHCSFCPTKDYPTHQMSLAQFEAILAQIKPYTQEIAYHIVGDPLTLPSLHHYLDMTRQYGLKGLLTTSGYFLSKHDLSSLVHPALKQINISLHSYAHNETKRSFEDYMSPIIALCHWQQTHAPSLFINLRLWNLSQNNHALAYNETVFDYLENALNITLHVKEPYPKTIRLLPKIRLHFDHVFEWPNLNSPHSFHGKCHGLIKQLGIRGDGSVVPCCLDHEGIMTLGNVFCTPLNEILHAPRAMAICEGFTHSRAVELLCQKCTYKERFNHA